MAGELTNGLVVGDFGPDFGLTIDTGLALGIVAMLGVFLSRQAVGFGDRIVLSKQVSTLEQAGYVRVRKGYVGKRPRTWLSLTRDGRTAYTGHLAALREIAGA